MNILFLQEAALNADAAAIASGLFAGFFAVMMAIFAVVIIIGIAFYIYTSFVYMAIGRKAGFSSPGLAWIPVVGPAIVASQVAEMHWWPILLLIGSFIPVVNIIVILVFTIFFIIWMWKTFEAVGRPGWWAIFMIIPILNIVYLVFLGIAAWGGKK